MYDQHVRVRNALARPVKKLTNLNIEKEYLSNRYARFAGSTELGHGCFGIAMTHPQDETKVIKIGPLWDGWLIWAAYCQIKAGTNPHLLKVYSIKRYEKHGLYVAVIERLSVALEFTPMRGDFKNVIQHAFSNGVNDSKPEAPGGWHDPVGSAVLYRCLVKNNWASLWVMLAEVQTFAIDNGLCRDLHAYNAMTRTDGTVVVTDPFSDGSAAAREALARMSATPTQLAA